MKKLRLSGFLTIAGSAPRDGSDEPTLEQLQAQIASLTTERDKHKGDYDTLKTSSSATAAELQKIKDADLSEGQRVANALKAAEIDLETAKANVRETSARLDVERLARKLNFVDEDDAYLLIGNGIEFDDQGKPKNVQVLLDELVTKKPHLVQAAAEAGTPAGGRPNNPARGRPVNVEGTFTRAQLRDATFYAANRPAILLAQREGRIIN